MNFLSGLAVFQLLSHNLTSNSSYTCTKFYNSPVDVSLLPDVQEIVSYVESQKGSLELIETVKVTETQDIKDAIAYYNASKSEEVTMTIEELIVRYGFSVEEHNVTTEDGYILTMHRIPGKGKPIYLQHGLLVNSADWVIAGPENGLSFFLASLGYDVWLGNTRGSIYSQSHVVYSTECAEFWQFSFHEIGYYDLPAMIDYILNETGQKKLLYMGHSQGGTSAYVLLSERPEYNKKLTLYVDFSPVAWMSHLKSPIIRLLALDAGIFYKLLNLLGTHSLTSDNPITKLLLQHVCGNTRLSQIFCSNVLFLIYGYDRGHLNMPQVPVIINHMSLSASTKQTAHYAQLILSRKFRQFDYGEETNNEAYGSKTPPDYDLSKVEAPVVLIYTGNDWFSNVTDVEILQAALPNLVDNFYINDYNHIDPLYAKDTKDICFPYISNLLGKYYPNKL